MDAAINPDFDRREQVDLGEPDAAVDARVRTIGPSTRHLLNEALADDLPSNDVAGRRARKRTGRAAGAAAA